MKPITDHLGALAEKFEINEDGCWIWTRAINAGGYGTTEKSTWSENLAHRTVWTWAVEPIPPGMTLDHLCGTSACVNPDHLEPVTMAENTRRAPRSISTVNARKTHCKNGHPFDAENTRITGRGSRECRTCHAIGVAKWEAKWEARNGRKRVREATR